MGRGEFHGRCDLALRVIRKPCLHTGLVAIFVGFIVRENAALQINPVDFQVVDSLQFLDKQMRPDEHPITVLQGPEFMISNPGLAFEKVLSATSQIRDSSTYASSDDK